MNPQDLDNFQREILKIVEEGKMTGPAIVQSLGCDTSKVNYNLEILIENGYLIGSKCWLPGSNTGNQEFLVRTLTDKGKVAIEESDENDWRLILRFIHECLPDDNSKKRTFPLDKEIANKLGLDLHLIRYYLLEMEHEEYIDLKEEPDPSGDQRYTVVGIKPKGQVASKTPNKLRKTKVKNLPEENTINQLTFNNSTIGNVATFNQGTMIANMGHHADDIINLVTALQKIAESFPSDQKELAEGHLEDLRNDYAQQSKPLPSTFKRRIIGLLSVATVIAVRVATATDFANNVLELSNKLEVPVSEIQPQLEQLKHVLPELNWHN